MIPGEAFGADYPRIALGERDLVEGKSVSQLRSCRAGGRAKGIAPVITRSRGRHERARCRGRSAVPSPPSFERYRRVQTCGNPRECF